MNVLIVEPIVEMRHFLEKYFEYNNIQYYTTDNIGDGLYVAQYPGIDGIFLGDCLKDPTRCYSQKEFLEKNGEAFVFMFMLRRQLLRDTPVCAMLAAEWYAGFDITKSFEGYGVTYILAKPFPLEGELEVVIWGMQQKAFQEKLFRNQSPS